MSEARTYVTLKEAARALNVHEQTIRNWGRRGLIRLARLPGSRHRRVPIEEVARLLAQMRHSESGRDVTVQLVPPPGDEVQMAEAQALAEAVRRELADLETSTTLEDVMSTLRGRSWSS